MNGKQQKSEKGLAKQQSRVMAGPDTVSWPNFDLDESGPSWLTTDTSGPDNTEQIVQKSSYSAAAESFRPKSVHSQFSCPPEPTLSVFSHQAPPDQTSKTNGWRFSLPGGESNHSSERAGSESVVRHGFSLARRAMSETSKTQSPTAHLPQSSRVSGAADVDGDSWYFDDDDEEEEDKDVSHIYRSTGDLSAALLYKANAERRVISQSIGRIGHRGQNMGLGHILGWMADDLSLKPSCVEVLVTCYVLDDSSPVQTDIKWSRPDNASRFRWLQYDVQLCSMAAPSGGGGEPAWQPVGRVRHPVQRIYRTERHLLVGRAVRLERSDKDLLYKLRVRAVGQLEVKQDSTGRPGLSHHLAGDWSSDIFLTWVGWENQSNAVQLTNL